MELLTLLLSTDCITKLLTEQREGKFYRTVLRFYLIIHRADPTPLEVIIPILPDLETDDISTQTDVLKGLSRLSSTRVACPKNWFVIASRRTYKSKK